MRTHDSGWVLSEGETARVTEASFDERAASNDAVLLQVPWLAGVRPNRRAPGVLSYRIAKRTLDVSLVLSSLPVTGPLLIACAAALKLESPRDPVFFRQMRTGRHGGRFSMFKFRTMVSGADQLKERVSHLNHLEWPDFKIEDDPRVTRVGRFLRGWSLDELPQLLNVLRGDMSLVGPRPTSFGTETYDDWHKARLRVLPGVTGLWQITGRGAMGFDERVRLDIAYIERRRLSLDLMILLRTFRAVLGKNGTH